MNDQDNDEERQNNFKDLNETLDNIANMPREENISENNVLSKNDLLSLFGGAPNISPSTEKKSEPNSANAGDNSFLKGLLEAEDDIEKDENTQIQNNSMNANWNVTDTYAHLGDDENFDDDIPIDEETSNTENEASIFVPNKDQSSQIQDDKEEIHAYEGEEEDDKSDEDNPFVLSNALSYDSSDSG